MPTTAELFAAIDAGDTNQVDALLDADLDLGEVQRDGVSPVRAAVYAGCPDLAAHLVDRLEAVDVFDVTALGDVEALRVLLDDDGDLAHEVAGDGFTALHLAAWFGFEKAAELLLARGADPRAKARNDTALEPLNAAAAGGHVVIAHLLLDRGADVDVPQAGGTTPLHSAAHRGDAAMVALLLGRGADPSTTTDDGRTAADLTEAAEVLALLR